MIGRTNRQQLVMSAGAAVGARPTAGKSPGYYARAWRRFRRNRIALAALIVIALLMGCAFGAPLIARHVTKQTYYDQNLQGTFAPPNTTTTSARFDGPRGVRQVTSRHWLGTDELGRDVLTRLAYGGRISLSVAFLALLGAMTIGLMVGALAGFYSGRVDAALMRFVDVIISIPGLFVLILIATLLTNNRQLTDSALYRRHSWLLLPVVIAALGWTGVARLVRGEFLAIRVRDYVEAARVVGASDRQIIVRHVLPNVVPVIIVWATLVMPGLILAEASLSYLGFGVQIPTPSWGNMLSNSTQYFSRAPHLVVVPGGVIFITALAINLAGNGLRDALDPRLME